MVEILRKWSTKDDSLNAFRKIWNHIILDKRNLLPVAQRIEALSVYGSWWALSEDSGFKSYPNRPEVFLVKNVVR